MKLVVNHQKENRELSCGYQQVFLTLFSFLLINTFYLQVSKFYSNNKKVISLDLRFQYQSDFFILLLYPNDFLPFYLPPKSDSSKFLKLCFFNVLFWIIGSSSTFLWRRKPERNPLLESIESILLRLSLRASSKMLVSSQQNDQKSQRLLLRRIVCGNWRVYIDSRANTFLSLSFFLEARSIQLCRSISSLVERNLRVSFLKLTQIDFVYHYLYDSLKKYQEVVRFSSLKILDLQLMLPYNTSLAFNTFFKQNSAFSRQLRVLNALNSEGFTSIFWLKHPPQGANLGFSHAVNLINQRYLFASSAQRLSSRWSDLALRRRLFIYQLILILLSRI